jgi:hypothetical protein
MCLRPERGRAIPHPQTDPLSVRSHAARALRSALNALTESERAGAQDAAITSLCDDVITRRLQLQLIELMNGPEPCYASRMQMMRDWSLLNLRPRLHFAHGDAYRRPA